MNGAIKEINNHLKQKDGQIGQENDFDDNTKTIASVDRIFITHFKKIIQININNKL